LDDFLQCKSLTKRYGNDLSALEDVSITIKTEGIFALLGRNGAGKTTLIRILATELMPSSGSARLNGLEIVSDANRIREQIAVMPPVGEACSLADTETVHLFLSSVQGL
jgi:ABC-2 type transport system ATP-binding protein